MGLSAIFVSGLSASGARWPPITTENAAGWETNLKNDFPDAGTEIFISHRPSGQDLGRDSSPWGTIDKLARKLSEKLQHKADSLESPLVFFCQGLGGYVVLKALEFLRTGNLPEKTVHKNTAAVIFFGTPLNPTREKDFRGAIRACATVELGTTSKVKRPDEHEGSHLADVLRHLDCKQLAVVSVYEGESSQYAGTKAPRFSRRSRIIVDSKMGGFRGATLLASKASHASIGNFDEENYKEIAKIIRCTLEVRNRTPQTQQVLVTRNRPAIEATTASRAPRMRTTADEFGPAPYHIDRISAPSLPGSSKSTGSGVRRVVPQCHFIEFPANPHFVGRKKVLEEITKHLVGPRDVAGQNTADQISGTGTISRRRAFSLDAPKGYGKTQTARMFAAKESDHFPYILWVAANDDSKLIGTYAKFAVRLGLVDETTDFFKATEKLREWFMEVSKPFLVIFDNAQDQVMINKWWPFGAMGSVLVTTLDPAFKTDNVAGNGMTLPPIDEADAVKMVLDQVHRGALSTSRTDDQREAQIIVKRVGCLPLAVQNCVGAINAVQRTLKQYSDRYPKPGPILEQSSVVNVSRPYAPYAKALKESIQDIWDPLDDNSKALLDVFSLLDPSKIPEQPFDFSMSRRIPADLKRIKFLQPDVFDACIQMLSKGVVMRGSRDISATSLSSTSLYSGGTDLPKFHIHDLHREFLRTDLTKNAERRQAAFDTVTRLVSMTLDRSKYPKDVTTRMVERGYFWEYFSHIESIRKFFESTWEEEGSETQLRIPMSFLTLLDLSSWLCYTTGFFRDGLNHVKTGEQVLEALEKDPRLLSATGAQDTDSLVSGKMGIYHGHACIATEIGDFSLSLEMFTKQHQVYEQAVRDKVKFPPGDEKRLEKILGGIANSHQGLGEQGKAEEYYNKCLDEAKEKDDLQSPFPVNKCRSQWARGAFEEASAGLESLISRREKKYGPDDTEDYIIGHMKYVLGNVRIGQNRLDEAFELHKKSLASWKITMGEHHHKTGDCYHKVGWHFARIGNWTEARDMLEQALVVYKSGKEEGFRHGEIARTSFKLGLVLRELHEFEKAAAATEMAKKLRKEVLQKWGRTGEQEDAGEDEYDTLVSLWAR